MRIVPPFDVLEQIHPGLGVRAVGTAIDSLALQRREADLRHRIVVGGPDGPARGAHAQLLTPVPEGERGLLPPVVRVVNHACWSPLRQRLVEGREHPVGLQVSVHRSADDASTPRIDDHGERQEAVPRAHTHTEINIPDVG